MGMIETLGSGREMNKLVMTLGRGMDCSDCVRVEMVYQPGIKDKQSLNRWHKLMVSAESRKLELSKINNNKKDKTKLTPLMMICV